jgi:hypothetical protein
LRPHPLFYGFVGACGQALDDTVDLQSEVLRSEQEAAR